MMLAILQIVLLVFLLVCWSPTAEAYMCILKLHWDPSAGRKRWAMPMNDICYCQGVKAAKNVGTASCPVTQEEHDGLNLWYTDNPGPLTKRDNWTPEMLNELLGRTEFCIPPVCSGAPMGMEDGTIGDSQLSSSTKWDDYASATNARLNYMPQGHTYGAWVAGEGFHDQDQWIQVDLLAEHIVLGIIVQGRELIGDLSGIYYQWVTKYKTSYSANGSTWNFVKDSVTNAEEIFEGSVDNTTPVESLFDTPVLARYIRIHPWEWNNFISLRFELLGCTDNG